MWLQHSHCLWSAIVTSDDLLQRVEQQILPLGVGLDLRQNEGEILLQVAGTDTTCIHITATLQPLNKDTFGTSHLSL